MKKNLDDSKLGETLASALPQLSHLVDLLLKAPSLVDKIQILEKTPKTESFFQKAPHMKPLLEELPKTDQVALLSLIAIGQGEPLLNITHPSSLKELVENLLVVDRFYSTMGGIIGYHKRVLELICEKKGYILFAAPKMKAFHHPPGTLLIEDSLEIRRSILQGLKNMPFLGEIYPIGGAGERLDLHDEKLGLPLPTAVLKFMGRSLLTGLILDLMAKEYLYFKLFGQQLITPIGMMTSHAKNNHQYVLEICERNHWFHRPKDSFFLFIQPSVPVLTEEGNWVFSDSRLSVKPGGHGVLWKLAHEEGLFDWFYSKGRTKTLIRQINNPMAGLDFGLLALTGIGCEKNKTFGFASCFRRVGAQEGVNILIEEKDDKGYHYAISNIEYTDFEKNNIQDEPAIDSLYSKYPANTNILFADLKAVESLVQSHPIPGTILNMKTKIPLQTENGETKEILSGRLESTMQNIADFMTDTFPSPLNLKDFDRLHTFLTYNERKKTISVTKNTYKPGKPMAETPPGCFYDFLLNAYDLLTLHCDFQVPPLEEESYLKKGPSFIFIYHPALGPLYSLIAQKLRGGILHPDSELQLYLAEVDIENLSLKGSLVVQSDSPLGHLENERGLYSHKGSKISLHNVRVENEGIERETSKDYWKNTPSRKEALTIQLHENSEFEAFNVTFKGAFHYDVPPNTLLRIHQAETGLQEERISLKTPSWYWEYAVTEDFHMRLHKHRLP